MHIFDENIKVDQAMAAMAATSMTFKTAGSSNGASVDMAKFHNYAAVISVNFATQWQGALTCNIAESTDNSTFSTTYLATKTIASNTTTDQLEVIEVSDTAMTPGCRYLRLTVAPAAGTGNLYSAVNCRFNPRYAAVSN